MQEHLEGFKEQKIPNVQKHLETQGQKQEQQDDCSSVTYVIAMVRHEPM